MGLTSKSRHNRRAAGRLMLAAGGALLAGGLEDRAAAAAFSSAASGNYNLNATWGGAANPANGTADTVVINAHNVTLSVAGDATSDSIAFANSAAALVLANDAATSFALDTLDLTGSNQTITINRLTTGGTVGVALNHTLNASTLLLGAGRTLTVTKGALFTPANTGFGLVINGGATLTGVQTFNVGNNGTGIGTITVAGNIAESGVSSIVKTAAGTLILSGNNAYTGGTNLNGGLVQLGSANAIGTTGTVSFGGGGLQFSATNTNDYSARFAGAASQTFNFDTNSQSVTFNTGLTSTGGSLLKSGAGTLTLTQTAGWTNNTSIAGGTLSISNANQVAGNIVLANTVAGNLTVTNAISLSNNFLMSSGFASGVAIAGTNSLVIGGTFTNTVTTRSFSATNTGGVTLAGNVFLSNDATSKTLILAGSAAGTLTVNGVIADSATGGAAASNLNISSSGPGIVILNGNNTYTGKTTFGTGVARISSFNYVTTGDWVHHADNYSSLGAPANSTTGTIDLGAAAVGATVIYLGAGETTDRILNLTGTTGGGTIQADGTGPLVFTSNLKVGTAGVKTFALSGSNTGDNEFRGNLINDLGTVGVTKLSGSTGKWILSGTNTYTGATTVSGGILQFAKQVSLYNNVQASWTGLAVTSGATMGLNVGGTGEFTAADIAQLMTISNGTAGFRTGSTIGLDTTNAAGGSFTYGNVIANPNAGGVVLNLQKLGTNKLVLDQANTYTGNTTVAGGTLAVTGKHTGAGGYVVAAGATLAGGGDGVNTGLISLAASKTVVFNNAGATLANLAPGSSVGKLTVATSTGTSGLNFSGGNYQWELGSLTDAGAGGTTGAGTNFDQLVLSGQGVTTLTLGGSSTIAIAFTGVPDPNTADPFWDADHTWKVIDVTGTTTTTGVITNLVNAGFIEGTFSTSIGTGGDAGDVFVNYTAAVPEPGSVGMAGFALALLLRRRRR